MKKFCLFISFLTMTVFSVNLNGQNPIIRDQFSADPTARVFNGKIYLFPSHDIKAPEAVKRKDWFCMEDYHVFSSSDLTDWTDHGIIVTQTKVPWLTRINYDMWAPDCVFRNGKYYFYFPVGGRIGVATADKPEGPYTVLDKPVEGVGGIDPCVLIDKDGKSYIYTSMGRFSAARLKDNMVEIDSKPQILQNLPTKGLIEGPFVFERNGIYYMTYPHVENKIERLEYAIGDNPMGPFKVTGVIMDETPMGTWTNHHSLVEYNGQWYLFYHQSAYSPRFDKNRAVCIDSLFFNEDGTIRKVIPTNRGVGITNASGKIEIDRYSHISPDGVSLAFVDTTNTFKGWKVILNKPTSWIAYNTVDFGNKKLKKIQVNAASQTGGTLEFRLDKPDGLLLASVNIPKGNSLNSVNAKVSKFKKGIHNLVMVLKDNSTVEVDWIQFAK